MVDPGATPHNLPRSGVVAFVGREAELNQIHQQLQQASRVAITALSGMGGIGKTELALQYALAQMEQNSYPGGICWLRVRESDISTQVIGFAQTHLDLVIPEGLNLDAVGQVAYCWQHWKPGAVLIVLDDVTDYGVIKPHLVGMPSRFKLLLTTRLSLGKAFQPLDLPVLDEAASLELLRSLTDPERINSQLAEAIALCEWVGYLPLGLELLGRYLEAKPDLTLAKLLQRLQDQRLTAQAFKHTHPDMTASLGVVAAFELSWQDLEESVQQLACWLSLFALSPIAWELVETMLPQINREEMVEDRRDRLVALHLLQRVSTGSYQLHQLLRRFFAAKRQERSDAEALREIYIQGMIKIAQQIPFTANREVYLA
ncbi:MAG TPA: NB-ARC domain-containing protein, partial [Allocoleopsis sp.]